jgi:tetratricopeptide (TPR) repeat protein
VGAALQPGSLPEQHLAATLAFRRGELDQARELLRSLDERDPYNHGGGPLPSYLLAEVAAASGDAAGTAAMVRRFHSFWPRGTWRSWAYPRSLYLLAAACERLGRRDEARRAIDRLLRLWRQADEGIPLLDESRRLAARLDNGPQGTPNRGGRKQP